MGLLINIRIYFSFFKNIEKNIFLYVENPNIFYYNEYFDSNYEDMLWYAVSKIYTDV
jgi:hypothetical protein